MATAPSEPSADTLSLISMQLRQGTARAHEDAESSHFVAWLMDGTLSAAAYADHTAQLWCVYSAQQESMMSEAVAAFSHNQAVFESLSELHKP
ncbi:biliverdin-producing heme oxygenase [Corynebacterium sp. ED61]|uniref:biliverdin-producing heme oxygenase n=1 Tax=Corynebacterium sp. ED61 TaxID=2211360 RepID=UPI0018843E78|nr:biliverdin-producing heme oxygenase [Corynebacterium sp. ED61]MBF0582185.1 biliverdin-producing heme oxygenase [Corynebacterium sp. ED61]